MIQRRYRKLVELKRPPDLADVVLHVLASRAPSAQDNPTSFFSVPGSQLYCNSSLFLLIRTTATPVVGSSVQAPPTSDELCHVPLLFGYFAPFFYSSSRARFAQLLYCLRKAMIDFS